MKTYNYLYIDSESGEEFIVEAVNYKEAQKIAAKYFKRPQFCFEISDFAAEMMGVDTY